EEIREGRFREDLFHRLNVIPLHVPPLRERRDDIPMLVQHFAEQAVREAAAGRCEFTPEAVQRLQRMDWSGNVRELRNSVERLLILSPGPTITEREVELYVSGQATSAGLSGDLLSCGTFSE